MSNKLKKKNRQFVKPYSCPNVVNFIEAAILVHAMMGSIILKEEFKVSNKQIVNSDSQLYKQAGNGVTVTVIEAIAEKLKLIEQE